MAEIVADDHEFCARGLAVVILDFRQSDITRRCLESIAAGDTQPERIVLVLNGGKQAESTFSVQKTRLDILKPSRNLGCARGRNLALNHAFGNPTISKCVVLDNDTVIPPNFIRKVAGLEQAPLEVIAPVIYARESTKIWSGGGIITQGDEVIQKKTAPTQPTSVDWAPGACLIIPAAAWRRVGEFDRFMNFLYEDIDWCVRLRKSGGRVTVTPQLMLYHAPNQSLGGEFSIKRTYLWARNGTIFRLSTLRSNCAIAWFRQQVAIAKDEAGRCRVGFATVRIWGLVCGVFRAWLTH